MAYLVITESGREPYRHELTGPIILGRAVDCDITLTDTALSRHHCRIDADPPGGSNWVVEDLQSKNGTKVGKTYVARRPLNDADQIQIGEVHIVYHAAGFVPKRPEAPSAIESPHAVFRELEPEVPSAAGAPMPQPVPRLSNRAARPPTSGSIDELSDTRDLPVGSHSLAYARVPARPHVEHERQESPAKKTPWTYFILGVLVVVALIVLLWRLYR